MIKTMLTAVLLLGSSAALASDNSQNTGEKGGSPVGPFRNLMTSGINPIYHLWLPGRIRARAGYASYGYAGNAFAYGGAYAGRLAPRPRRLIRSRAYGFGTNEEENPPGLLPSPRM